jgi:hypothetical protein
MADIGTLTVAGSFDDRDQARQAVTELLQAGFAHDQIGWLHKDGASVEKKPVVAANTGPEKSAAVGALAGGGLGGLIGAALALTMPGAGPVLVAGILVGILGGTAVGITGGGLVGALIGLGMPHEEADYFEREVHAGRTLVTVQAGERHAEAAVILRRCGASGHNHNVTTTGA